MVILKLAIRNIVRHRRRTLILGTLIALGMLTLFVMNSIFENVNSGLQKTFVGSFTGDVAISEHTDVHYSLFGSEVPIAAEYESIPPLSDYNDIVSVIDGMDIVTDRTAVVSGLAQLQLGGYSKNVALFGVDPNTYFKVCSDIIIESGDVAELARGGVFINSACIESIEKSLGRPITYGEEIVFGMYVGGRFNLKKGYFAGVHRYVGSLESLDNVVLADVTLVRSIANYTLGYTSPNDAAQKQTDIEGLDLDDLFSNTNDTTVASESGLCLDEIETVLSDTKDRDKLIQTDSGAWSFILLKTKNAAQCIPELIETFKDKQINARVLSWRSAAGVSAQTIFIIQAASYVGLGLLAFGTALIVMNALVISVLERTSEIGTMRSLGADIRFVKRLFIAESMLLSGGASVVGISAGYVISIIIACKGIHISNPLLVSLFGGTYIYPSPTLQSILIHFCSAVIAGSCAWIYPVSLATHVQPITAMAGR